jgi:hypothetical protein
MRHIVLFVINTEGVMIRGAEAPLPVRQESQINDPESIAA